jgi:hypothetical protein
MMCRPEERDLQHAARRALGEARAAGLEGEALVEAAIATVAAIWAHVDREAIRAAVLSVLRASPLPPGGSPGSA